jgi:hypothetical protein
MSYWTGLAIIRQAQAELGLTQATTIVGTLDVGTNQMLALLNSAGNELITYYPWQNLKEEFTITTTGAASYALPTDWGYFVDQTQWDRTNHWPLLGPKSPQEWAWIKGGLLATAPRVRYRVLDNLFFVWPVATTGTTLAMEYTRNTYAQTAALAWIQMVSTDTDVAQLDPWLLVKFIKLKFYQLKGFDTGGVLSDFTRLFELLTGKDVGAPTLSLNRVGPSIFVGPWSVPDGNWNQ